MTGNNNHIELKNRLISFFRKQQKINAFESFLIEFTVICIVFFILVMVENFAYLTPKIKTIVCIPLILVIIVLMVYHLVKPNIPKLNIINEQKIHTSAQIIGRIFSNIKDDLLNVLQLIDQANAGALYSTALIDAAFSNVYQKTKGLDFNKAVSFTSLKRKSKILIPFIFLIFTLISFTPLKAAAGRLLNYNTTYLAPQKFYFDVVPKNARINKSSDLTISVKIKGELPDEVFLKIKNYDEPDFKPIKLERDSNGIYTYKVNSLQSPFYYFAEAEDIKSDEYKAEVVDYPIIKSAEYTITPPSYSGLKSTVQLDNGNASGLAGTNVGIKITSSKKLKSAFILFEDTTQIKMNVDNNFALGSFRITKDNSYKVIITDVDNNQNQSPVTYSVKAFYDESPSIELLKPLTQTNLSTDNRVITAVKISDDYGFSKLVINYKITSKSDPNYSRNGKVDAPFDKSKREQETDFIWNLTELNLRPENIVEAYFEVFDNDFIKGPKSAKSAAFVIKIPTLDEVLNNAENTQINSQNNLESIKKDAEELKKNIEKTETELRKDKKDLSWQEKEKVQNTIDKFKQLQSKSENVAKELQRMQEDLQKNNLLSKETLEKYMELQDLLHNLSSDEMRKMMDKLQNALNTMDRQLTQDALKNMKLDEEVFKKSIERTLNLLKRVQVEQKMDEINKRLSDFNKNQENIDKETKSSDLSNKNNSEKLSDDQKNQTNTLDKLEDEMKNLADKMDKLDDMPKDKMQQLNEKFEQQKNQELSKKIEQNLKQNNKQQAQQMQQQLSNNMNEMQKQMMQMQTEMSQKNQVQTFKQMSKIMDNLINLSKDQEKLKNETKQLENSSTEYNKSAEGEDQIKSNLDKLIKQLSDLSQKTFAITPEMGKALGDAKRNIDEAGNSLKKRDGSNAMNQQNNAMTSLNKAAQLMKGSMESMMQGGGRGGDGMMSLMQQLQQLTQQQMQINNMTQQLNKNGGQMDQQIQSQMQKLAQQQELIKKSLEQLNKEAQEQGNSKKLPGLDNVPKQMDEIVSDLKNQAPSNELIQKQERILSRMLDAQKSVNTRDFEKNRESFTGKELQRNSPNQLSLKPEERNNKLKDEINKSMQEGYNKDYQQIIRKYFELLQK